MPITLPTTLPPSRDDKPTFAQRGNDAWAHLYSAWPQLNSLEENVNAKEISATTAATTATYKAGESLASANAAGLSNDAAEAAKNTAVTARDAALAALDSFDDRYLGAKSAAPTLDNDGAALLTGALYWDTTIPGMRAYTGIPGSPWATLPAATAGAVVNTPAGNIAATNVQDALNELDAEKATVSLSPIFAKANPNTPALLKTAAGALSVKAGTAVLVSGITKIFSIDTAIAMPALVAGSDYSVWVKPDGSAQAVVDTFAAPAAAPVAGAVKIGGFHYGLVAAATTVAGGSFATTGTGMIWTQAGVDAIAGINKFSIWDLKFRPLCDPRGMTLVNGVTWVDIYLCSTDTAVNGTSKAGSNIASGTVLPKIPAAFGGNGVAAYTALTWWTANELARANQKRLMWEHEFVDAAYGVTENQSIDAVQSTYPTTTRNAGYTSKYGLEQASGHHWVWGQDSNFFTEVASPAGSWKDLNGGRGQLYTFGTSGLSRVVLGGSRGNAANSGSRASSWIHYPWGSLWSVGLRAVCDHLQLV